jgi:predicted small secreted protein
MKRMMTGKNLVKWVLVLVLAGLMSSALSACNTVDGVGQDLSSASRGVRQQL